MSHLYQPPTARSESPANNMPATGNTANAEETDNAAAAPAPAPEPAADPTKPEHINLKFHDQHGNECHFKLKKTMRLKKAMDAFSARTSRERRTLRFFFEGLRVLDDHTPEQLEMEEGDVVEAHLEQIGGGDWDA